MLSLNIQCDVCKRTYTVLVPKAGYKLWASGQRRIQDAMPRVSVDDRELLISHTCAHCWNKLLTTE